MVDAWYHYLLQTYVTKENIDKWSEDTHSDHWGNDSTYWACKASYVEPETGVHIVSGDHLEQEYYEANLPIVEERIAMAGVRLSVRLNSIFV
jgi:hypothetical protein